MGLEHRAGGFDHCLPVILIRDKNEEKAACDIRDQKVSLRDCLVTQGKQVLRKLHELG